MQLPPFVPGQVIKHAGKFFYVEREWRLFRERKVRAYVVVAYGSPSTKRIVAENKMEKL